MNAQTETSPQQLYSIDEIVSYIKYDKENNCITLLDCEIHCNFIFIDIIKRLKTSLFKQEDIENENDYIVNVSLRFENTIFHKLVYFNGFTFTFSILFKNNNFHQKVDFDSCRFHLNSDNKLIFEKSIFYGEVNFEKACFKGSIHFHSIDTRNHISFKYCSFEYYASFSRSIINDKICFYRSSILGVLNIEACVLIDGINFSEARIEKEGLLRLSNINYEKSPVENEDGGLNLRKLFEYRRIKLKAYAGVLNMNDMLILGQLYFMNVYTQTINLKGSLLIGQLTEMNLKYKSNMNRETAILLKNSAQRISDTVMIIEHRSEELRLFYEEYLKTKFSNIIHFLIKKIPPNVENILPPKVNIIINDLIEAVDNKSTEGKTISNTYLQKKSSFKWLISKMGRFFSNLFYCFLELLFSLSSTALPLWFYKYSNNFGLSWKRGIMFTLLVATIFYSLFLICSADLIFTWNPTEWIILDTKYWRLIFDAKYWKGVLTFLWLFDGFKQLDVNSTLPSYIFFILGKILIAYGIYQTVSAFRKYGK